ncbi:MAG: FtsQ-type POTRA domain-containing protein [Candidatus Portnoybacteria bacterium]
MKKKKKKISFKIILASAIFFCLLGGVAYFLIWSPFLWIEKIETKSDKEPRYYTQEEIREIIQNVLENKLYNLIPQKSIFFFSKREMQQNILDRYPEIREVEISRQLPNSLEIQIQERENVGVWCQIEYFETETTTSSPSIKQRKVKDCFNIDRDGVIYKEAPLIESSFVLNIFGRKDKEINIREQATTPQIMSFILFAKEKLPEIKTTQDISLSSVDFEVISNEELRVKTNLGWEIYFNPAYSVESQLDTLDLVLNEQIKEELSNLEYIDLRIQGRVYYK